MNMQYRRSRGSNKTALFRECKNKLFIKSCGKFEVDCSYFSSCRASCGCPSCILFLFTETFHFLKQPKEMESSEDFVAYNSRSAVCFEVQPRRNSEQSRTRYPVESHVCTCAVCGREFGENATVDLKPGTGGKNEHSNSNGQTPADDFNRLVIKQECEFFKSVIQDKIKASQRENRNVQKNLTEIWESTSEAEESVRQIHSSSFGKNKTETKHVVNIKLSTNGKNQTKANCVTDLKSSLVGPSHRSGQTKRVTDVKSSSEKSFLCNECGKRFRNSAQLQSHAIVHSGKRLYICSDCGKHFSRLESLRMHYRTHTGEKPYVCGVCERRFSDAGSCRRHARTHTGEKPFVCVRCGKAFVDPSGLRMHIKAHDGIKPYGCEECGFHFAQATQLKMHRSVHTGEKLFICDECGKRFTRAAHLKGHLKRHRGELILQHACATCGKKFSKVTDLKTHVLIHSGEKPHLCVTCGKQFRRLQTLHDHQRLHTGEKPYKCLACGASFKHSSALKLHQKAHESS